VTDPNPSLPPTASPIVGIPSILDRLPLESLFPVQQPIEVDLGSGDGSFLVNYAATQPGRNFIGAERLLGRLRKIQRKTIRRQLTNIRLVRIEAGYFLKYLLPPHSVASLHVYFPDPWPKRKQQKHRLVNEQFPGLAAQILSPGGTVYFRTDDEDYFLQMTSVFAVQPEFVLVETPAELTVFLTDFETDFIAQGVSTLRAAYQRRPFHHTTCAPEALTSQPIPPL
jgi:tRNA (guanine-N7-)-methyltransferase